MQPSIISLTSLHDIETKKYESKKIKLNIECKTKTTKEINYIGLLQEFRQKKGLSMCKYEYIGIENGNFKFACICTNENDNIITYGYYSNNKKMAKQIAAKNMLEILNNNDNLVPQ